MLLDFFTSFTSKIKSERRIVLSVLCLVSAPLAVVLTGSLLYVEEQFLFNRVLVFTLAGMCGLCCAMVVRTIRQRRDLLVAIRRATLRVQQDEFTHKVDIRSNDEYQQLAAAFNNMTAHLDVTFQTMTSLCELDRLILSGAAIKNVVKQALTSTNEIHVIDSFVFLWKKTPLLGQLYFSDDEGVHEHPVDLSNILSNEEDPAEITKALASQLNRSLCYCHDIHTEGQRKGLFLKKGDEHLDKLASRTISDLTDRLSVALTNSNRERTLFRQANYDALTGLLNRQAFTERLHRALQSAKRNNGRGAVLFTDLDRFKQVNDTQGHKAGDELLSIVASRLEANMRDADSVARLGGDEFGILIGKYTDETELVRICKRIMEEVSRPITINRVEHTVDASIGVSIFPKDGTDARGLLMRADAAMYKAKEQVGSAFAFFDDTLNKRTKRRVQIETQLRQALRENELYLSFQPILNLKTEAIECVEGLMRWRGSRWMPDDFIPVAEETGLIHDFTSVLIRDAIACIAQCAAAGVALSRVAINVSSRQLINEGIAHELLDHISESGGKPAHFEVEITESSFLNDAELVARELNILRDAGMTIALDDFGTGISSLNMLRTWPLDVLKIDKSLLDEMFKSKQTQSLIAKIIEIAQVLHLDVVAEGVETHTQLNELKVMGCDLIQGYVIAKPLQLAELIPALKNHTNGHAPLYHSAQ